MLFSLFSSLLREIPHNYLSHLTYLFTNFTSPLHLLSSTLSINYPFLIKTLPYLFYMLPTYFYQSQCWKEEGRGTFIFIKDYKNFFGHKGINLFRKIFFIFGTLISITVKSLYLFEVKNDWFYLKLASFLIRNLVNLYRIHYERFELLCSLFKSILEWKLNRHNRTRERWKWTWIGS